MGRRYEIDDEEEEGSRRERRSKGTPPSIIIRKVAWGIAILMIGMSFLSGFKGFHNAESAPQQCAACAGALLTIITFYVGARAIDQILS